MSAYSIVNLKEEVEDSLGERAPGPGHSTAIDGKTDGDAGQPAGEGFSDQADS